MAINLKLFFVQVTFVLSVMNDVWSRPVSNREGKFLFDGSLTRVETGSSNSPIYYIRMPPMPYSFIPGLGYVSHPGNTSPAGPAGLVNLPLPFIGNGKPVTVYQWNGAFSPFPVQNSIKGSGNKYASPDYQDSKVHRLKGHYQFNGKPNDVYLLNSMYDDEVLNHLYP